MEVRYSKGFLNKLEDIFAESDYVLRYEKGNFKSGYCLLKDTKVAIINKFYSLEGKIVFQNIFHSEKQVSLMPNLSPGVYLIQLEILQTA